MTIIFTYNKKTRDGKKTHTPNEGGVRQGETKSEKTETTPLVVTEYGVSPQLTPVEIKRVLNFKKFLTHFRGEREF